MVIIALGILIWQIIRRNIKNRRVSEIIDEIKKLGLEDDIKNFIQQFGKGLVEKGHDWVYGNYSFSFDRIDKYRIVLERKGIKLDDKILGSVLRFYIDELEIDLTSKYSSTPANPKNKLDELSGEEFENLLGRLYSKMGYIVTHSGQTGDQGVDLIAIKGNEKIAIQAKKRNEGESVGNDAIQQAFSGQGMYGCNRVVVITTTTNFTREALEAAKAHSVDLISKPLLQKMLLDCIGESWS
jgi:restriction system protein